MRFLRNRAKSTIFFALLQNAENHACTRVMRARTPKVRNCRFRRSYDTQTPLALARAGSCHAASRVAQFASTRAFARPFRREAALNLTNN